MTQKLHEDFRNPPMADSNDDLTIAYMAGHTKGVDAGIKQAQQVAVPHEPIAWAAQCCRTQKYGYIWHEKDDVQGWIHLQHQSRDDCTYRGPIPLYAAPQPPQAERVPMTVVEIFKQSKEFDSIYTLTPHSHVIAFARTIEAHHGIGVKP